MNRTELEKHLGEYVDIKIFDGSVYRGTLRKTGTEEVKNDPNLYLKSNYYFLAHKGTYITNSCLFRVSHIRKTKGNIPSTPKKSIKDLLKKATQKVVYIIRRLTPVEGERLQGYPDDWTKYGADGNIIADTARYRAIGK